MVDVERVQATQALVSQVLDDMNKKGRVKQYGYKYLHSYDEIVEAYRQYTVADLTARGIPEAAIDLVLEWRVEDFENDFGALLSIFKRYLTQH